ncbi:hypothetical protein RUND412_002966 [Rhizina undulata]
MTPPLEITELSNSEPDERVLRPAVLFLLLLLSSYYLGNKIQGRKSSSSCFSGSGAKPSSLPSSVYRVKRDPSDETHDDPLPDLYTPSPPPTLNREDSETEPFIPVIAKVPLFR